MARQIDIDLTGAPIITGSTLSVPEHAISNELATKTELNNLDYVMYTLNYDANITSIKVVWPAGYSYAQIIYQNTTGSDAELSALGYYDITSSHTLTNTKQQFSELAGIAVMFTVSITGGDDADFMVKFTKD